jgi:hypothetical protein
VERTVTAQKSVLAYAAKQPKAVSDTVKQSGVIPESISEAYRSMQ